MTLDEAAAEEALGPDLFSIARRGASRIVSVTPVSPLVSSRWARAAFRIEYEEGTVVKGRRFETEEAAERFARLSRLARLDAFPRLLDHRGCAALIEWVDGVSPWSLEQGWLSTAGRAGDILRRLHELPVGDPPWPGAPDCCPDVAWHRSLVRSLDRLRRAGVLSEAECAALDRAAVASVPPAQPTCVVLGDLAPENMVVGRDGNLRIIDTDGLRLDGPEFDITRTWYRWPLSAAQWDAFESGYGSAERFRSWREHFAWWAITMLVSVADFRLRHDLGGAQQPLERLRAAVDLEGRTWQPTVHAALVERNVPAARDVRTEQDMWAEEESVLAAVGSIEDGWCGGTQPLFLYRLSRSLKGLGEIVELGTYAGKSTSAIALGQLHRDGRPIHTIDRATHPRVDENIRRLGLSDWVRRVVGTTHEVAAQWTQPIEFLFIDAGHVYPDVRGDIDAWTPFVVEGGLVAVHDYPGWEKSKPHHVRYAIHRALHETLMNDPDRWRVISDREHGSLIVFRRIDAPRRVPDDSGSA